MAAYTVVSTRAGLSIHRDTCKRVKAEQVVGDVLTYRDATKLAACCKPQMAEVNRQRQEAGAGAAQAERDAAADRIMELRREAAARSAYPETEPTGRKVTVTPTDDAPAFPATVVAPYVPGLSTIVEDEDGLQHEALDVIITPAPEVPASAKPEKAEKPLSRGQQARARSRELNNHRGKGKAVTDEELDAYVRKVRAEHPESSVRAEQEYAYWVEGLAIGRARWDAAWERTNPTSAAVAC